MPDANPTGNHTFQTLGIGKINKPTYFTSTKLHLHYQGQKRAWVNKGICLEWFRDHFVLEVTLHFKILGLPQKASLLLDNAPWAEDLTTEDGNISGTVYASKLYTLHSAHG